MGHLQAAYGPGLDGRYHYSLVRPHLPPSIYYQNNNLRKLFESLSILNLMQDKVLILLQQSKAVPTIKAGH